MKKMKKMNAKSIVSIAASLLLGSQIVAPAVIAIPTILTASTAMTTSAFAVNNNLIGCLDIAEVTGNLLHVRGWALDLRQNGPINVHVYFFDRNGKEYLVEGTLACDGRPDVCIAKGRSTQYGYGYDRTFQIPAGIDISSIVGVRVYGIDSQGRENQLISIKELPQSTASNLIASNLNKVNYQKQPTSTSCKSTSLAMALNLLAGSNKYNSQSLGGGWCVSTQGQRYAGSNGVSYVSTYKTDTYVGSWNELRTEIERSIDSGLPIVVPVHSANRGTKHHWVVLTGRTGYGGDYVIVDPLVGSGSIKNAQYTMGQRGYAFGLTDYSNGTHYGYISFK